METETIERIDEHDDPRDLMPEELLDKEVDALNKWFEKLGAASQTLYQNDRIAKSEFFPILHEMLVISTLGKSCEGRPVIRQPMKETA
jgi:hypothetical protein